MQHQHAGIFLVMPLHSFGSKSKISRFGERIRDGQYSLVSFLFAVFFYSRWPPCPSICNSGGTCPPVPYGVGATGRMTVTLDITETLNTLFSVVNFWKCVVTEVVLFSVLAFRHWHFTRCGGILDVTIITYFLPILTVKKVRILVVIRWSYTAYKKLCQIFGPSCRLTMLSRTICIAVRWTGAPFSLPGNTATPRKDSGWPESSAPVRKITSPSAHVQTGVMFKNAMRQNQLASAVCLIHRRRRLVRHLSIVQCESSFNRALAAFLLAHFAN